MSKEVQCEQLAKGIANAAERITDSFAAVLANIGAFNPVTYALLKETIKFTIASIFVDEIEKATATTTTATSDANPNPEQPEFADCR